MWINGTMVTGSNLSLALSRTGAFLLSLHVWEATLKNIYLDFILYNNITFLQGHVQSSRLSLWATYFGHREIYGFLV